MSAAMTQEQQDLAAIRATLVKLEEKFSRQDARLKAIEDFVTSARAMVQLGRWVIGLLGIGGLGTLLYVLSQASRP